MKKNKLFLAALLAAALCGHAAALKVPAGAVRAELTLPDGFKVSAELALTPAQQSKGLMFRPSLDPGAGMLFVFKDPGPKSFWMKNTLIDLDMVFLDADLKVLKVFHRVPRSRADQPEDEIARASAPASLVLELPAGAARAHRLKPGSVMKISFPPLPAGTKKTGGS
jgi:hypothetical protein